MLVSTYLSKKKRDQTNKVYYLKKNENVYKHFTLNFIRVKINGDILILLFFNS